MTSNTKILKQTIELLTGELKQVGEYRDNAVKCGVELNKQLAAMTARAELAERQVAVLIGRLRHCSVCPSSPRFDWRKDCKHSPFPTHEQCVECLAAWSRAEAEKGGKV